MEKPATQTDLQGRLATVLACLKSGDTAQAERVCGQLLAAYPDNPDVLHMLGTVKTQTRDAAAALALFDRAADLDPHRPAFLFSLGKLQKELARFADALATLDKLVARDPNHALGHCLRGDALSALGRPQDALAAYDRALALDPRLVDALNNRGNELRSLARHVEALAAYDSVLALVPAHPPAIINRGNALLELGRYEEALAAYQKALPLVPQLPQLYVKMGDALQSLDRFAEALIHHERASTLDPGMPQAANGRAMALTWLRRLGEAEAEARRAIALEPGYAPVYNTLGNILLEELRHEEAIGAFRKALHLSAGLMEPQHGLSIALLRGGQWTSEAWRSHESRRYVRQAGSPPIGIDVPEWQGEPLAGKRILVWAEQGLGDSIQFFLLLCELTRRGAEVVFHTRPQLARLLRSSPLGIEIVISPPRKRFDFTIPVMSLPRWLDLDLGTIPATSPYLGPEADRVEAWKQKLGAGFKVGIAWQGNPDGRIDIGRSFKLAAFAPLSAVSGIRLISLQKGAGAEQLEVLPPGMTVERLTDFDNGPDAFIDTAAVMQSLDLVITSDTAVAHLAGALGRPVWVALQYAPDWRWLVDRSDVPWYPTMRLFRQPARGDWDSVFKNIAEALAALTRPRRPDPLVPVSWGEVADKISILQIKHARIASPAQRANVARELAALEPVFADLRDEPASLVELRTTLRAINERLWDIEDAIRAKEAAAAFDPEFIELARAVYTTNDERGRIKRLINDAMGSNLVEEKQYHAYAPARQKPSQ